MKTIVVSKPLTRAGICLGVGLGGFLDGILFHQIFQVHSMLSARLPKDSVRNMEINMFWDGIFHSFTWIMTAIGVLLLFRAAFVRNILWSGHLLVGSMFLGWGLFNLIEGITNHHILHLHHVVESRGQSIYDLCFLLSGVVLSIGGWVAIRSVRATQDPLGAD